VQDIARAAASENRDAQISAIGVLGSLSNLNRQELALAASTLHDIALISEPHALDAQRAFAALILTHATLPEAIHLAMQAIKVWEEHPGCRDACLSLVEIITPRLPRAEILPQATRSSYIEQAHILAKAALTTTFAQYSIAGLRTVLEDRTPALTAIRRELAGITAAAIRRVRNPNKELQSLKALAAQVFATGTVAATKNSAAALIHNKASETVTAQNAEQRRQFGLAVTIELIKSIPLIGRPLNTDEFENCLRFSFSPTSVLPANRFWPTKAEWHTIKRCLLFAEQAEGLSALRLAALFRILATRIKVEDPKDPRESKRRADVLTNAERLEAIEAAERISSRAQLTTSEVEAIAQEIAGRILAPEFSGWKTEITEQANGHRQEDAEQLAAAQVRELVGRVLSDPSGKIMGRLKPEELRLLGSARSLSISEFKNLVRLLQPRAVADNSTLTALLLITQAQHSPEVTAVVRTATLGNLLNEARRYGAQTPEFERSVLAASAKIPRLKLKSIHDAPNS
jgi:hypothetical protein